MRYTQHLISLDLYTYAQPEWKAFQLRWLDVAAFFRSFYFWIEIEIDAEMYARINFYSDSKVE